ncbi:hypothetical protein DOY81_011050 [Sarcophaga bullata]|nr:hypothetical protein DOY81_011050 [Sarcophaga bullata]
MFKFVVLFACIAAVAVAAPATDRDGNMKFIPILKSEINKNDDGSYKYIDEDGKEVEVFYTAGVNGFVPYGKTINEEISAVAEAAKICPKKNLTLKVKRNTTKPLEILMITTTNHYVHSLVKYGRYKMF